LALAYEDKGRLTTVDANADDQALALARFLQRVSPTRWTVRISGVWEPDHRGQPTAYAAAPYTAILPGGSIA
jgi:hypothetical protein